MWRGLARSDGLRFSEHLEVDGVEIFAHVATWGWRVSSPSAETFPTSPASRSAGSTRRAPRCCDMSKAPGERAAGRHAIRDAVAAELIRWNGNRLDVSYTFGNQDR